MPAGMADPSYSIPSPRDRYQRLGTKMALIMLALIAVTYVVNAMDRIVFSVVLDAVRHEYHFSLPQAGFQSTIYTLGLGIFGIPAGFLLDRFSRKANIVAGIAIYSVFTIITVFSIGFFDMAFYRAVSGVGEAMQNAAIFTACGAYFFRHRALALGVLNFAYGVGSFIGPRLGASLLSSTGSWRTPMYVFGVIGLIGAALVLVLVVKRFTEQVYERLEKRVDESYMPRGLLNRNTVLVGVAAIFGGVSSYGYLGLYPTFLLNQLHFSLADTGLAASMFGLGALMGIPAGALADRASQKWVTFYTLIALGIVGYCLFNVATTPGWQNVLSFLEGAAGSGFLYVNNYSLIQRSVRSELAGRASGLVVTCVYLPSALAGYLFGSLVNVFGWGSAATIQLALLLIIPIAAVVFIDTTKIIGPGRRVQSTGGATEERETETT